MSPFFRIHICDPALENYYVSENVDFLGYNRSKMYPTTVFMTQRADPPKKRRQKFES